MSAARHLWTTFPAIIVARGDGCVGVPAGWAGTEVVLYREAGVGDWRWKLCSFRAGYAHTITVMLNTSPDQEKIEISIDPYVETWN